jgi:succinylglutamic semialdehyde dehydrogenase
MDAKGNFIDGSWEPIKAPEGTLTRNNPARPDEVVFEANWDTASVDRAVSAARDALPEWDRLGREARVKHLHQLADAFREREDAFAEAIAREAGKPLWEARGEAQALAKKVNIMTDEGLDITGERQPEGLDNGRWRYRPLGVTAVLGPFNFPVHLPNGHIIPSLANGNTVVIKPSELTGGCMQLYLECVEQAGLPDGVVNMVQGPGEVGRALSSHRGVNGVLFTGSWETGQRIKQQTMDHYWKLLALEMGGKNTAIVLDDADLDQAAHEIAKGAFMTTGQRCSGTSRVVVRSEVATELIDRLADITRRVTTGDPLKEDVFMGPLITEDAKSDFVQAQHRDEDGALVPIVRGDSARNDLSGHFVSPGLWLAKQVNPRGDHQGTELFGPDVVVYPVQDDAQATRVANATEFGLSMSLFTDDEARFDDLSYDLRCGVLNLNRSTAGASSRLPFGGVNKSGNHRASAVLAGEYCTYPQAQLREEADWDEDALEDDPLRFLAD